MHSDMIDVVWSNFVMILNQFYNFRINQDGSLSLSQDAWTIHQCLLHQSSLPSKRPNFSEQNLGNNHWISSVMCNPWVLVFQDTR